MHSQQQITSTLLKSTMFRPQHSMTVRYKMCAALCQFLFFTQRKILSYNSACSFSIFFIKSQFLLTVNNSLCQVFFMFLLTLSAVCITTNIYVSVTQHFRMYGMNQISIKSAGAKKYKSNSSSCCKKTLLAIDSRYSSVHHRL